MGMSTIIQFPERDSRPLLARVTEEIKALMGRYGVTQMHLAAWLGKNQSVISDRLRGTTEWKVPELEAIAEGFNVHPAVLMGGYATTPRPDGPNEGLPIHRVSGRRDSNSQHSAWNADTSVVELFPAAAAA